MKNIDVLVFYSFIIFKFFISGEIYRFLIRGFEDVLNKI